MILTPSLIRVVFKEEPYKSEFQGKLTTPGNSVLTRCSFSNSDESCPPPLLPEMGWQGKCNVFSEVWVQEESQLSGDFTV